MKQTPGSQNEHINTPNKNLLKNIIDKTNELPNIHGNRNIFKLLEYIDGKECSPVTMETNGRRMNNLPIYHIINHEKGKAIILQDNKKRNIFSIDDQQRSFTNTPEIVEEFFQDIVDIMPDNYTFHKLHSKARAYSKEPNEKQTFNIETSGQLLSPRNFKELVTELNHQKKIQSEAPRPEYSKQTGAAKPSQSHNTRNQDIDDLLSSMRYIKSSSTYNKVELKVKDENILRNYPIEVKNEYIAVRKKGKNGYILTIDKENEVLFDGYNHKDEEKKEIYENEVYTFLESIKELYKADNTISEIIHEREKQFIKQHPKTEILNTLTKEKE